MPEHILFLTGKLAEPSLNKVLASMQPTPFSYGISQLGISVAGLLTADFIRRRLVDIQGASRIIVPGRTRGDLADLAQHYGIPVERGPDELKDLPQFFGRHGRNVDLSHYDVRIFAEIVEAPHLSIKEILTRAEYYRSCGANVIDLGMIPETPFPHLEEAIAALIDAGYQVSIDSHEPDDLLRGGHAGAHFLLSLKEETLWIADEVAATPVLIPSQPGDLDSLLRAVDYLKSRGRRCIADSILDPIHFGFTESIVRYQKLRSLLPDIEIMMGIGNLTELTDADTSGINAVLMGIVSELGITNVLATEVSPHARSALREADLARRMMYAAHNESTLPRGFSGGLMSLHDRQPFPYSSDEIADLASAVKDPNFRVHVGAAGIHVYNRDGMQIVTDPFDAFQGLKLDGDGGHAFYMGVELARAEIAWLLGKRYAQDEALSWGCAVPPPVEDLTAHCAPGQTRQSRRKKNRSEQP